MPISTEKHIIISEKWDKKAGKYLVEDLPYPYTNEARAMEIQLGAKWSTRLAFQRATFPKVVKKVCDNYMLLFFSRNDHDCLWFKLITSTRMKMTIARRKGDVTNQRTYNFYLRLLSFLTALTQCAFSWVKHKDFVTKQPESGSSVNIAAGHRLPVV